MGSRNRKLKRRLEAERGGCVRAGPATQRDSTAPTYLDRAPQDIESCCNEGAHNMHKRRLPRWQVSNVAGWLV